MTSPNQGLSPHCQRDPGSLTKRPGGLTDKETRGNEVGINQLINPRKGKMEKLKPFFRINNGNIF